MESETLLGGAQWAVAGRLLVAAALGGAVGFEREYRGYPAGIRTMALVCMGAALFTEQSVLFQDDTSPSRIASQIVTGIGFLGGGVILLEGLNVRGVTTAATIWMSAAIGIAVAMEQFLVAVVAALLAVLLLEARPLTKRTRGAGATPRRRRTADYGGRGRPRRLDW